MHASGPACRLPRALQCRPTSHHASHTPPPQPQEQPKRQCCSGVQRSRGACSATPARTPHHGTSIAHRRCRPPPPAACCAGPFVRAHHAPRHTHPSLHPTSRMGACCAALHAVRVLRAGRDHCLHKPLSGLERERGRASGPSPARGIYGRAAIVGGLRSTAAHEAATTLQLARARMAAPGRHGVVPTFAMGRALPQTSEMSAPGGHAIAPHPPDRSRRGRLRGALVWACACNSAVLLRTPVPAPSVKHRHALLLWV